MSVRLHPSTGTRESSSCGQREASNQRDRQIRNSLGALYKFGVEGDKSLRRPPARKVERIGEVESRRAQSRAMVTVPTCSQRTLGSAINAASASTIRKTSRPYRRRKTHSVSRSTVVGRRTVSRSKSGPRPRRLSGAIPGQQLHDNVSIDRDHGVPWLQLRSRPPSPPTFSGDPSPLRQPATSSIRLGATGRAGRSRIPSSVSSTMNSVPGSQRCASRTALGRMTCPFEDNLMVFNRRYLARQDPIRSRYSPKLSKVKRLAAQSDPRCGRIQKQDPECGAPQRRLDFERRS